MPSALNLAPGWRAGENGEARRCYQHERASANQRKDRIMASEIVSVERVRELLNYDPETGSFTRRVRTSNRINVNAVAGGMNSNGYARICLDGRKYYAHQLAWIYIYGVWPTKAIDHLDGNQTNNRIANLREASASENGQNRRGPNKGNVSRYLGVSWYKANQKWMARIMVNRHCIHLGCFSTAEAAHAAYLTAKQAHHPFGTKETQCLQP